MAYRKLYGRLDRIVCQSRDMQQDLVTTFGLPAEKTCVIHNPIAIDRVRKLAGETQSAGLPDHRSDKALRFVTAGRLVFQKGFDLLLEAVALCRDLPIELTILGDGPLRDDLSGQAARLGIAEQVRFVGYQENPYAWFAAADAFVVSSRFEGLSNVMLEALACGTPLIATPAPGGTLEVLQPLAECEIAAEVSAPALEQAIRKWVARRPGRVPDAAVEPYAVDRIVEEYEREILGVAGLLSAPGDFDNRQTEQASRSV
jgi:glycosyltransferase involved in cell wall biosynthesis